MIGADRPAGDQQHPQIQEADLRRWLALLKKPDQLYSPEIDRLLKGHGRLPATPSRRAIGQAAAALLTEAIENLAIKGGSREEELPHVVLKTCFLEGAKLFQAAAKLGLSERQLSRERARAIALLKAELEAPLVLDQRTRYRPEPIPSIRGFMARPALSRRLRLCLEKGHFANVHGPPGIGKTSLVAELATELSRTTPVLWYRCRVAVNASLTGILLELGDYLHDLGHPDLSDYLEDSLPDFDAAVAARFALKGLSDQPHLLVFDDYHLIEDDLSVSGFSEELLARLPNLRIIRIARRRLFPSLEEGSVEVPPLSRNEMRALLKQLGVKCSTEMLHRLHGWTEGNTHLTRLAASWLRAAPPDDVPTDLSSFSSRAEVQSFLMRNVTELLDSDDRAILDAASIFRGRCSDDALAHTSGRTRGAVLDASLRLVRAYLATRNKDGDSAFFHATVRDYIYERLDAGMRAELHLRAASWYRMTKDNREATYHRKMAAMAEAELEGRRAPRDPNEQLGD